MSDAEVIDGQAEEVQEQPDEEPAGVGTAMRVAEQSAALTVASQVKPAELVQRLDSIEESMNSAMRENVDYGKVPGTDKPTLLKPGAEKLSVLFQLDVQLANEKQWGPGDHLTVTSHATVFHAPSGARLGYGEGICSTRERKYAYRQAKRKCPVCEAETVIKGKQEYGGGWLCWKKRNGCGATFSDDDPKITGQEAGEIENPDLPDTWNTVVKMAEKRARVDAVLAVTGASALFTQDAEDLQGATAPAADEPQEQPSAGGTSEGRARRSDSDPATEGQRKYVLGENSDRPGLLEQAAFSPEQVDLLLSKCQNDNGQLTFKAADWLIKKLKDGSAEGRTAVLEAIGWSDVPGDAS